MMSLSHLNSDQRQYYWLSLLSAIAFAYLTNRVDGLNRWLAVSIVVIEGACALSIYRGWRVAPWLYLLGSLPIICMSVSGFSEKGYNHMSLALLVGGVFSCIGFFGFRDAMQSAKAVDHNVLLDPFVLSKEHEDHLHALVEAYERAFGPSQWVHHIVPKALWLHRYADHVIAIPPTPTRATWLYGTLLVSALSGSQVELILERPQEDRIGAIGTLARLTEYFTDVAPLEEWNTMGIHTFFGEESDVRGLLFCKPPDALADGLELASGRIAVRYVAGITEDQLISAQAKDHELGGFAGAKALHAELGIANFGLAHLPA